ncbi:Metallo-beta-lactamase superfamily protein [Sphingobium faniae]|nr:Metallo-beta-lactamase superfamily protein [Sphingobium faniae]
MPVTLRAFTCGWFQSPLTFFLGGEDKRIVRSPIPAYLIEHPQGRALFDTGLGYRFRRPIEERLGPDATGFEFDESADIAARLRAIDVDPASIRWIINSHFHADHCGGNASIPNATIIVQTRERAAAAAQAGSKLYDRADFDLGHPVLEITGEHDLFGGGSVTIIPTYGHTVGHQSVKVKLPGGDVVLAADCCYLKQSLDNLRTSPSDADADAALETLRRLAALREKGTRIFYGHDEAFWKTLPTSGEPIR